MMMLKSLGLLMVGATAVYGACSDCCDRDAVSNSRNAVSNSRHAASNSRNAVSNSHGAVPNARNGAAEQVEQLQKFQFGREVTKENLNDFIRKYHDRIRNYRVSSGVAHLRHSPLTDDKCTRLTGFAKMIYEIILKKSENAKDVLRYMSPDDNEESKPWVDRSLLCKAKLEMTAAIRETHRKRCKHGLPAFLSSSMKKRIVDDVKSITRDEIIEGVVVVMNDAYLPVLEEILEIREQCHTMLNQKFPGLQKYCEAIYNPDQSFKAFAEYKQVFDENPNKTYAFCMVSMVEGRNVIQNDADARRENMLELSEADFKDVDWVVKRLPANW